MKQYNIVIIHSEDKHTQEISTNKLGLLNV